MRKGERRKGRRGEKLRTAVWRFLFGFIALCPLLPLFLSLLCLTAFAQLRNDRGWVWQNPLPQGNALYSIHFATDNLTGFAVGDDRTILRTEDGGFTWENQTSPVDTTLSAVFVRDSARQSSSELAERSFRPTTRKEMASHRRGLARPPVRYYFRRERRFMTGWAVGTYGHILKTTDGGAKWRQQLDGLGEHLLKVSAFSERDIARCGSERIVLIERRRRQLESL